MKTPFRTRYAVSAIVVALSALALSAPAAAQDGLRQAGSTGTVDESDLAIYETSGPIMRIHEDAPDNSKIIVRYNITDPGGWLWSQGEWHSMGVRFIDNGDGARITLKIKVHDGFTGEAETLWKFDSNDFGASEGIQRRGLDDDSETWDYNFDNNYYWVEVTIERDTDEDVAELIGFVLWDRSS